MPMVMVIPTTMAGQLVAMVSQLAGTMACQLVVQMVAQ
jgi:hypothetical protein